MTDSNVSNTALDNANSQLGDSPLDIVVLFSLGVSMNLWQKTGLAAREKAYYDRIIEKGHAISFLTYGKDDAQYEAFWQPMKILPWLGKLTHFVKYACVAPFHHKRSFQAANIVKSNQSQGALVGALARLINPKLRFVLRCGWVRTKEVIRDEENRTGLRYYRAVFFEWLGFKLANAIIVVTVSDADYLIQHYSANKKKIHVIPNSIDTDNYRYKAPNIYQKVSQQTSIKLLMVGRLVEAKNFHKVFAALSQLEQPFDITVVGDGDYRHELEECAKSFHLAVQFEGSVANDQLARYYADNDIVLMPEAWGSGMPKVVLEAMASGALIIASNIRSVRQLLRSGENGFICEPTTASILDNLQHVLAMKDSDIQAITAKAREDIEKHYSMDSAVEKELRLYQSLL